MRLLRNFVVLLMAMFMFSPGFIANFGNHPKREANVTSSESKNNKTVLIKDGKVINLAPDGLQLVSGDRDDNTEKTWKLLNQKALALFGATGHMENLLAQHFRICDSASFERVSKPLAVACRIYSERNAAEESLANSLRQIIEAQKHCASSFLTDLENLKSSFAAEPKQAAAHVDHLRRSIDAIENANEAFSSTPPRDKEQVPEEIFATRVTHLLEVMRDALILSLDVIPPPDSPSAQQNSMKYGLLRSRNRDRVFATDEIVKVPISVEKVEFWGRKREALIHLRSPILGQAKIATENLKGARVYFADSSGRPLPWKKTTEQVDDSNGFGGATSQISQILGPRLIEVRLNRPANSTKTYVPPEGASLYARRVLALPSVIWRLGEGGGSMERTVMSANGIWRATISKVGEVCYFPFDFVISQASARNLKEKRVSSQLAACK